MAPHIRDIYKAARVGSDPPNAAPKVETLPTVHCDALSDQPSPGTSTTGDEKQNIEISSQSVAESKSSDPEWADLFRTASFSSVSQKLENTLRGTHRPTNSWRPGFWQLRPLLGLCGLLLSLGCIFGSFVVLYVSNGQPTAHWQLEPTVYLAILTALGNSALILARSQAIPISWWYHASRGSSIRRLQRHWEVSRSLFRAVIHLRNLSLLHITCIVCTFAIIDGALLQRASTVMRATTLSNITLDLVLPPEIPTGFFGIYLHGEMFQSEPGYQVLTEWANDAPINYPTPQCAGTCTATVQAPGLTKRKCTVDRTWEITEPMLSNISAQWGWWHGYFWGPDVGLSKGWWGSNSILFSDIDVNLDKHIETEAIEIQTGIANWSPNSEGKRSGDYREKLCIYTSAIVEYDVMIKDGTIDIIGDPSEAPVIQLANNTAMLNWTDYDASQPITITGLATWLSIYVNNNATAVIGGGNVEYSPNPHTFNRNVMQLLTEKNAQSMSFDDPTPGIVKQMNQLMFRSAIMASQTDTNASSSMDPGVRTAQNVKAHESIEQNVYKSDLRFFAGAAVLQITAVVLVLQMFWGYWTLGTPATLSPFGVALAFNAPLLNNVNSAAGVDGVVAALGDTHLEFGVVGQADEEGGEDALSPRLGLAEVGNVRQPQNGMIFTI